MNSNRRFLTVALAALVLVGAAAPTVAAQDSDDEPDDGILPSLEEIEGMLDGLADRLSNAAQGDAVMEALGLAKEQPPASESADALDSFVDENEGEITAYANEHVADEVDLRQTDVVQVHLQSSEEQRTVFVTASVADNGSVESVDVVNQTDRPVDLTLSLDEYATRHLPEELDQANEAYLVPNEGPDGLRSSLLTEYSGHVTVEEGDQPAPIQS